MRKTLNLLIGLGLTLLVAPGAVSAQSLGEVARKEEARRQKLVEPAKVYTNDNLGPEAGSPAPLPAPGLTATPPSPSGGQAKPGEGAQAEADDPKKDEAYWRGRMSEARSGLERSRTFAEALQSRINVLSTDFVNRDDPAQRNTIANDRQKALAELERVKQEIAQYEKAIQDIEDEARKAGVPPGWLR